MPIENNNNKRKFDFFKDYSHLLPEDQAIRSRLRDMIRGAEVSSKKHNTINSFKLPSSIFNRRDTNITASPNFNQEEHDAIKKYILASGEKLNSLNDKYLDILKLKISKFLNDEKNLASIENRTILKTIKNIFKNLLDKSDANEDTFILKHAKPYLKIDNVFFNKLLENTTSNNMIDLIKSKEIPLSEKNIETLWETGIGKCNVQLELLKSGYLDKQNKIKNSDIEQFYGAIELYDKNDEALKNEFEQAFEQMQARRKEAQKLSYTKLKRSKTQSCLSMLESHLPQKNLKF